ncbi:MAG: branched-chain amino acid ABC transporter permease [Burkholderiales bacterium]
MSPRWIIPLAITAALPWVAPSAYIVHLMIQVLLWSFIYTGWSLMGRFGLVSFGHGAFMGVGAYVTVLLWNLAGITPWIGIPLSIICAMGLAVLIGYPCFRFGITGHYFALVTLALTEVVRSIIVALRDSTGGSLGITPTSVLKDGTTWSISAIQFADKAVFFYIALAAWLFGIWVWNRIDRSMMRYAMEAIGTDEQASASVGVNVTRTKLTITIISAALTALGGALFGQYQQYINPDTVAGIGVSLQIVFAVIAGGMFVRFGPTVGAVFTLLLTESLRVGIGNKINALDSTIYGLMLVLFIIYMPTGILGKLTEKLRGTKP